MPTTGDVEGPPAAAADQVEQRPRPIASQAHRRPPAARSVSLRHSPTLASRKVQAVKQANPPTTSPSEPSSLDNNKNSSGETSNAERWFEKSNNNVRGHSASFVDDDPPFYHRDSSNESPPNEPARPTRSNPNQTARFRPSTLDPVFSTGSDSEEYRSVIDDLTIENRKLKAKLRKYAPYKDKLDSDRLFEVKVHGLPAAKKRELDELLARFAQTLHGSPYSGSSGAAVSGRSSGPALSGHTPRALVNPIPNTSKTSPHLKFTDSGYGSATLSGQTPTAHSGSSSASQQHTSQSSIPNTSLKLPPHTVQSQNAKDQSIRSYLHDIPEGLLPKHSVAMTEKTKEKVVVRRLEQIFAGRGAATGGHQLPIQQQEVSNSAARADRTAIEARGQIVSKEGIREAHIMDMDEDTDMVKSDAESSPPNPNESKYHGQTSSRKASVHADEQRPTRPLDLDPHRAQIPADNMEYFRHLGFDVSQDGTQLSGSSTWIYLNLLINMAQLHTVNVTTEFVKRAISENSSKLELSSDGRKVRWRGDATHRRDRVIKGMTSMEPSTADHSMDGSQDSHEEFGKSRKRPRLTNEESSEDSEDLQHAQSKSRKSNAIENKLSYTPLFSHKNSQDESNDTSLSDSESIASSALPDEVTGGSSSMRRMMNSKRRENGPIVFYNNANFCTDLSGDTRQTASPNPTAEYIPYSVSAVGSNVAPGRARRMFASAKDSPLYKGTAGADAAPADEDFSMSGLSPTTSSPKRVSFAENPEIEFEVSGLGGVRPADHLAITVVRQRRSVPSDSPPEASSRSPQATQQPSRKAQQPAPRTRLSKVLLHRNSPPSLSSVEHIVSTHQLSLPPSELPPPSFAMTISDSGSGDSEDEASDESPPLYGTASNTLSAPQPMQVTSFGSDASSDRSDDGDGDDEHGQPDDDGVVDLLAVAREIDPASIRAREREYDAEMAERLAEEIPAGSSAATAGGGSGFNSPAMAMDDADMGVSDAGVGEEASIAS